MRCAISRERLPVGSLYRAVAKPFARKKKKTLQDGSEVLGCSLLRAGYKDRGILVTERLPAVGAMAESRALPLLAGVVVGWLLSSHDKASRREVLGERPKPLLQCFQLSNGLS